MKLHRVVLAWAGDGVVGSAVSVLHYDGSNQTAPPVAALKTAFSTHASLFSSGLNITFPGSGDTIEDTTGGLDSVWTSPGGGVVNGTTAGTTVAGVGACIGWTTGGIVQGSKGPRKLRGRTFLVPLAATAWDVNGTFSAAKLTELQALANEIQASGPLAIWHRPTSLAAANGNSYGVLSNKVRDKAAVLRSRRD
jgi:hypothetical protein